MVETVEGLSYCTLTLNLTYLIGDIQYVLQFSINVLKLT